MQNSFWFWWNLRFAIHGFSLQDQYWEHRSNVVPFLEISLVNLFIDWHLIRLFALISPHVHESVNICASRNRMSSLYQSCEVWDSQKDNIWFSSVDVKLVLSILVFISKLVSVFRQCRKCLVCKSAYDDALFCGCGKEKKIERRGS